MGLTSQINVLYKLSEFISDDNRQSMCSFLNKYVESEEDLKTIKEMMEKYRPAGRAGFWFSPDKIGAEKRLEIIRNTISDLIKKKLAL